MQTGFGACQKLSCDDLRTGGSQKANNISHVSHDSLPAGAAEDPPTAGAVLFLVNIFPVCHPPQFSCSANVILCLKEQLRKEQQQCMLKAKEHGAVATKREAI